MSTAAVLLAAIASGALASLITGLLTRPKTTAEARHAYASAEVGLSTDAREWTKVWMEKATAAEAKAQDAEERIDALEADLHSLVVYLNQLRSEINHLQAHVPPPPKALEKYLREN